MQAEQKLKESTQQTGDGLVASQGAGEPKVLPNDYIAIVIAALHEDKDHDAGRRKETAEQKAALKRLQLVLESRLSSAATPSSTFDEALDDDEAVLLLMCKMDADGNGSISEKELLGSSALTPEMRSAFDSAFACDQEAVEEALAHLEAEDFGDYHCLEEIPKGNGGADVQVGQALPFDAKASARAVFSAAVTCGAAPSARVDAKGAVGDAAADNCPNSPGLDGLRTREAATAGVRAPGHSAAADATGTPQRVTKAALEKLAASLTSDARTSKLVLALSGLAKTLLEADGELDFLAVKRAARRVPRVAGQRMEWVRGVNLDAALARHLPPGTLDDGLEGVRAMPFGDVQRALEAFLAEARVKILGALLEAKTTEGSRSAAEANSKFTDGFQGSFATLKEFHAGAEASLNLGYPNPDTMKGILLEHTKHPSAEKFFVTPNYRIITNLLIEYAWAVYEECPDDVEAKNVLYRALDSVKKLVAARNNHDGAVASVSSPDALPFFPGEVGDSFSESLVMFALPGVMVDSDSGGTAKACEAAVQAKAKELLKTDEEKARGVTTLDHEMCMGRIKRGASVLLPGPSTQAVTDSLLRVGVMLPMSSARTNTIIDALQEAVAVAAGLAAVTAEVSECTWTFTRYTGVESLSKWLDEQSLDNLKKMLPDQSEEMSHVMVAASDLSTHDALCTAMVASFVRTELQTELCCVLESSASDTQIEGLLRGWNVQEPWSTERVGRIKQAAAALDSEKKWHMVEGWVQLYRGRIQGRIRLGLKGLVKREEFKITQYQLTKGEVLGLYLYTGPEFMVMNGICRSFPQSILDLLKGEGAMAENRLCTTLFCIASALKKLSQTADLPGSRYAVHTLLVA